MVLTLGPIRSLVGHRPSDDLAKAHVLSPRKMHDRRVHWILPAIQLVLGPFGRCPQPTPTPLQLCFARFTVHMWLPQPQSVTRAAPMPGVPLGAAWLLGRFVSTQVHARCLDSEPVLTQRQHFPALLSSPSICGFQFFATEAFTLLLPSQAASGTR